jgi:hypothetical protein
MFYLLDNGFDTDECICVFQGQVIVEPQVEKVELPDLSIIEDAVEDLRKEIEGN